MLAYIAILLITHITTNFYLYQKTSISIINQDWAASLYARLLLRYSDLVTAITPKDLLTTTAIEGFYHLNAFIMGKKLSKPLIEMDKPKGKVIKYWESAKAAGEYYNINVVNISYNVNGTTKQAKGHYFRFATPKEIEQYSKIIEQIEEPISVDPAPVDDKNDMPAGPASVIPEVVQPDELQEDTLSPFARLLEESKKKFQNNPK